VRDCSSTCFWGTCHVLATELCNGLDDNCNGSADETFPCRLDATQSCTIVRPTKTCSGTQTCMGPGCTWGSCIIPSSGSYVEVCNAIDDNCDGTVDEPPPAPNVLCSPVANGTVSCTSGACRIAGCTSGWADCNSLVPDG
jgi:hypothetical protein